MSVLGLRVGMFFELYLKKERLGGEGVFLLVLGDCHPGMSAHCSSERTLLLQVWLNLLLNTAPL